METIDFKSLTREQQRTLKKFIGPHKIQSILKAGNRQYAIFLGTDEDNATFRLLIDRNKPWVKRFEYDIPERARQIQAICREFEGLGVDLTGVDRQFDILRVGLKHWRAGDPTSLFLSVPDGFKLQFVERNVESLRRIKSYEKILLRAYQSLSITIEDLRLDRLRRLFALADRERLLAAGDPLPEGESFKLYRGTGKEIESKRGIRVHGLSWTDKIEIARKFSGLYTEPKYESHVYTANVPRAQVLAFRKYPEREFVLRTPLQVAVTCIE